MIFLAKGVCGVSECEAGKCPAVGSVKEGFCSPASICYYYGDIPYGLKQPKWTHLYTIIYTWI